MLIKGSIETDEINALQWVILVLYMTSCFKGYKWRYLKTSEIRLFGLMTERLFLDSIGYGNELKYGYLAKGGVIKTPA